MFGDINQAKPVVHDCDFYLPAAASLAVTKLVRLSQDCLKAGQRACTQHHCRLDRPASRTESYASSTFVRVVSMAAYPVLQVQPGTGASGAFCAGLLGSCGRGGAAIWPNLLC